MQLPGGVKLWRNPSQLPPPQNVQVALVYIWIPVQDWTVIMHQKFNQRKEERVAGILTLLIYKDIFHCFSRFQSSQTVWWSPHWRTTPPLAAWVCLWKLGSRYETVENLGVSHVLRLAANLVTCEWLCERAMLSGKKLNCVQLASWLLFPFCRLTRGHLPSRSAEVWRHWGAAWGQWGCSLRMLTPTVLL